MSHMVQGSKVPLSPDLRSLATCKAKVNCTVVLDQLPSPLLQTLTEHGTVHVVTPCSCPIEEHDICCDGQAGTSLCCTEQCELSERNSCSCDGMSALSAVNEGVNNNYVTGSDGDGCCEDEDDEEESDVLASPDVRNDVATVATPSHDDIVPCKNALVSDMLSLSDDKLSRNNDKLRHHHHHHVKKKKKCKWNRPKSVSSVSGSDDGLTKVTPIFVWAKQDNMTIVEVYCEDYDKRNRLKITKTSEGSWKAIPRTSRTVTVSDDASSIHEDSKIGNSSNVSVCSDICNNNRTEGDVLDDEIMSQTSDFLIIDTPNDLDECAMDDKNDETNIDDNDEQESVVMDEISDSSAINDVEESQTEINNSIEITNNEDVETENQNEIIEEKSETNDVETDVIAEENISAIEEKVSRPFPTVGSNEAQSPSLPSSLPSLEKEGEQPQHSELDSIQESSTSEGESFSDTVQLSVNLQSRASECNLIKDIQVNCNIENDESIMIIPTTILELEESMKDSNVPETQTTSIQTNFPFPFEPLTELVESSKEQTKDIIIPSYPIDLCNATEAVENASNKDTDNKSELEKSPSPSIRHDMPLLLARLQQPANNSTINKSVDERDDKTEDSPLNLSTRKENGKIAEHHLPAICGVKRKLTDVGAATLCDQVSADIEDTKECIRRHVLGKQISISEHYIEAPIVKKVKLEDVTLKDLITGNYRGEKFIIPPVIKKEEKKDIKLQINHQSSKLKELLIRQESPKQHQHSWDATHQLKHIFSRQDIEIPDPLIIPKSRLLSVLTNPASELPTLLGRPELRFPEVLGYPNIISDPDYLVLSVNRLYTLVKDPKREVPLLLTQPGTCLTDFVAELQRVLLMKQQTVPASTHRSEPSQQQSLQQQLSFPFNSTSWLKQQQQHLQQPLVNTIPSPTFTNRVKSPPEPVKRNETSTNFSSYYRDLFHATNPMAFNWLQNMQVNDSTAAVAHMYQQQHNACYPLSPPPMGLMGLSPTNVDTVQEMWRQALSNYSAELSSPNVKPNFNLKNHVTPNSSFTSPPPPKDSPSPNKKSIHHSPAARNVLEIPSVCSNRASPIKSSSSKALLSPTKSVLSASKSPGVTSPKPVLTPHGHRITAIKTPQQINRSVMINNNKTHRDSDSQHRVPKLHSELKVNHSKNSNVISPQTTSIPKLELPVLPPGVSLIPLGEFPTNAASVPNGNKNDNKLPSKMSGLNSQIVKHHHKKCAPTTLPTPRTSDVVPAKLGTNGLDSMYAASYQRCHFGYYDQRKLKQQQPFT